MNVKRATLAGMALLVGASTLVVAQSPSPDVTQWRGTNRDGVVGAFTAPAAWPESLTQKWKIEVGAGYATPLLVGNRMYIFSRQGGDEVMSAINPDTGAVLWHTGYPVSFKMHPAATKHGEGPKSTPTYAGGKLFSIGMTGIVTAFDAATGKQLWQKPGSSVQPMYTSHAFSPIVERDVVVFHMGGHNEGALTAFDVNTGDVKWRWGGDGPGYGSPVVAEFGGTRQLVTITQGKMISVEIATGKLLWERPFVSSNFTNSGTPIVYGQTLIASGNADPLTAISVARRDNQWVTENAWANVDSPTRFSNSVVVRDAVFGFTTRNSGQYFSVDAKTGKTLWLSEPRQGTNAAILRSGDTLFSLQDDGNLVVFKSTPTAVETVKRYKVADSETWAQPTIAGNRIFVKDVSHLTLWTLN